METPLAGSVLDAIRSGRGDMGYQPRPAEVPCEAMPGSRDKIDALAARLRSGEELWHEDDNRREDGEGARG